MRNVTRSSLTTWILLAALTAACAPATEATKGGTAAAGASAPVTPSLTATAAPAWRSRDMTLPAGCSITDHTRRLAVYKRDTGVEFPLAVLGLIDLGTGRSADVVTMPVSSAERHDVLGRALSDEWLAWEEADHDESQWRLYAAPIDAVRLTVGKPLLVDSANSAERGRPLFGVDGPTVVWTCPEKLRGVGCPVVRARDLPDGAARVVHRSDRRMKACRLDEGEIVLTTEDRETNASVISVLDARFGRVLREVRMGNVGPVSHYADTDGALTAWAAYESMDAPWPAVYVRDGERTAKVTTLGCDPVVRAGRVLFEVYGEFGESGGIEGVDPAAGTRFTLLPMGRPMSPAWQLCASSARPGGLALAWQDEFAFPPGGGREPVTHVRVWQTD